jgi:hypothetical protein
MLASTALQRNICPQIVDFRLRLVLTSTDGGVDMRDKIFVVYLKRQSGAVQHVTASRATVYGKHLAFIDRRRGLAGLFSLEIVDRWYEIPRVNRRALDGGLDRKALPMLGLNTASVEQDLIRYGGPGTPNC